MESKLIALAAAGEEAKWFKNLLLEIPIWSERVPAIPFNCDCEATVKRVNNNAYNVKSRHIRLRHNYLKQLLRVGVIAINYVRSMDNLAEPFTKGLAREQIFTTSRE